MNRLRFQWGWTRAHQAALLIVCAAASILLAVAATGREWFEKRLPVWPIQVDQTVEHIDPNAASAVSLQRLRGIGQAKARAIVDYCRANGPDCFRQPEDLTAVHGIGERLVAVNRAYLQFPSASTQR